MNPDYKPYVVPCPLHFTVHDPLSVSVDTLYDRSFWCKLLYFAEGPCVTQPSSPAVYTFLTLDMRWQMTSHTFLVLTRCISASIPKAVKESYWLSLDMVANDLQ